MEVLVRISLAALLGYLVVFPYGVLYSRGKAGKGWGAVAGAWMGVVISFAAAAPDFEPRGTSIAGTIITTGLFALAFGGGVALVDRLLRH